MNYNNIPQEIKNLPQWVLWKLEKVDGRDKLAKVPYQINGNRASSTNTSHWTTFDKALEKYNSNGKSYKGIGFVFSETDPFVGIDMDKVIDSQGNISEQVKLWIEKFNSFIEYSQSGSGLHIICKGKIQGNKNRKENIEIYEKGRYFAITGDVIDDKHREIKECQSSIDELYNTVFKAKEKKKLPVMKISRNNGSLQDYEIINLGLKEESGKFNRLFNGDTSDYNNDESSADQALCNKIAFYTKDSNQIDSIFRQSALFRDKWEREDYRNRTINKAIEQVSETYNPEYRSSISLSQEKREIVLSDNFRPVDFYTDTTNAEELARQYNGDIKYCEIWGKWLIWDGKKWNIDDKNEIQQLAKQTILNFYSRAAMITDDDKRSKLIDNAKRSEALGKRKAMIELAKSEKNIPAIPSNFDENRWILNLNNGTLNLRTCELYPHKREDYITKKIPVNYNPDAECPTWKKFLNTTFNGDKELISFIQKSIGYSLSGSTQEQCIYILHGTGANGKSTFLTTIKDILGEYAQQTPSETLMAKKNQNSSSNDLARIRGSRFVSSVETEEGKTFAEVLIKQLTGEDTVTARFLFNEYFDFKPECKIWLASNHKPKIRGTDYAIWRRIRLIPFLITIPEEERDPLLLEKLRTEQEGILAWAIAGCKAWQNEGIKIPDKVKFATDDYKDEMDTLGDFIKECCVIGKDFKATSQDLYNKYIGWCNLTGEKEITQRAFGLKLSERGYEKEKGTSGLFRLKYFYKGIGIISNTEEEDL